MPEYIKNIDTLQKELVSLVSKKSGEAAEFKRCEGIDKVLKYDLSIFEIGFKRPELYYNLIENLDSEHPDFASCSEVSFFNNEEALNKLLQFLKLCQLAKENNLDQILPTLVEWKKPVEITKMNTPSNFARFFKSEYRDTLRKSKTIRQFEMPKNVNNVWESTESVDFSVYARFRSYHKDQLKIISDRIENYRKLRLRAMVDTLEESVRQFEQYENYYGFQRVSMTVSAVVLARMHNAFMKDGEIYIKGSDLFDFEIFPKEVNRDYIYQPMIIPAHLMPTSKSMKKIMDHLDNFPEANGKAIFDHYMVLTPGILYPRSVNQFYFIDQNKQMQSFNNLYDTKMALDTLLIKEDYLRPILMAEKDGKCYFISFWD